MGAQSEKVLRELCDGSFLTLWSFPNPYSDDGLKKRGEGKELCDLLVVFGDDVIIFSDKSCAMSGEASEPTTLVQWNRWYRKAITKSVDQIFGAERWLRSFPERIFADSTCTQPLNVGLPPPERARYHRIVVALGAGERCRSHFGGGSGSLPIEGGRLPHSLMQPPEREIFTIGDEGGNRGFVHVFDDVTLEIMLQELDTIVDFTEYLTKKEQLFATTQVMATGEEDLLGWYLLNVHSFIPESETHTAGVFVDERQYAMLTSLPQYHAGKAANEESYAWDALIEHFIGRWKGDNLANRVEPTDFERAVRAMAATSRLERRQLGSLVRRIGSAYGQFRLGAVYNQRDATRAFAAVNAPVPDGEDLDVYREKRVNLLLLYARSLKVRSHILKEAVVVGFGRTTSGKYSEDLLITDFADWSDEIEAATIHDMEKLEIGAQGRKFSDHEFPVKISREQQRRMRQIAKGMLKPNG